MKNLSPLLILAIAFIACNNDPKSPARPGQRTQVDSLKEDIDKAHISGMGKMGRLTRMSQYAAFAVDSINKLPAGAKKAAGAYQASVDSLLTKLKYAETSMDKWMMEYKEDSMSADELQHTRYLKSEKRKVDAMLESVNNSMKEGDAILKKKI